MASSVANLKQMNYTVKDRPYPEDTLLSVGEAVLRFSLPPYRHELWPVVEEEDSSYILYIIICTCALPIIGFFGYKQIIKRRFKWNIFNRTPRVQAVAINELANVEPMRAAEPDAPINPAEPDAPINSAEPVAPINPAEPVAPINPAEAPQAAVDQAMPYCECLPEIHAETQTVLTGPKKLDEHEMACGPSCKVDELAGRIGPYTKPKRTYTVIKNTNKGAKKTTNAGSAQSPRWR